MLLATCNWFQSVDKSAIFEEEGDHADEMETSLMMYLYPELVLPLEVAGNGQNKKFRVKALNDNWAWAERKWTKVTNDTGIGNPYHSTAEKGEKFFLDLCQVVGKFFVELANTPVDDFYGY